MPQIRFATARSLLDAFPELSNKLSVLPVDEGPIDFLRKLLALGKLEDGIMFCAHLLPRREAVWWACGSVKGSAKEGSQLRDEGFLAAEAWVRDPDEQKMRAALETGTRGDKAKPTTWLALSAGWAGGMLSSNPKMPVPMPQYLTARAARIAILLSTQAMPEAERSAQLRGCIGEGIKLAEDRP
jgi:hypothetical protein